MTTVRKKIQDIATLLGSRADMNGDLPAIETEAGEIITYSQLFQRASHIGASLISAGIRSRRSRPRIGIVLPNGSNMATALLGVSLAGEAAPFNPASTASEFDMYFQNAAIDALLVGAGENGSAVSIAERRGVPLLRLSTRGEIAGYEPSSLIIPPPNDDDIALVLMTSGSTGKSKLVPLTHRNVCTSADDVCQSLNLGTEDRCLSMWEQYHIGGLVDLLLAPLLSGGCIISTPGFDAAVFFEILRDRKPTWFQGVPTTLNDLVNQASRNGVSCQPNSLRFVRSVAAALAPSLMHEVEKLLGAPVIQTFGMTEAGPLIASTALPPAIRKPGSVGRSCGAEIKIIRTGVRSADSEHGEVAVRGANVFRGYENDDAANRTAFRDGWFLTGDLGFIDPDGDLFLTGRIKQMINRGGEKINPQEVDDVLLSHPDVAEAASFAVRHKTLGEDIGAAVVLKQSVTTEELRTFLGKHLSAFKVPSQIVVLERLPRNPVGKIDRLALAGALDSTRAEVGHVPPRSDLEILIASLWSKELSVEFVGVHDDFSVLGGDSLSSVRIWMALEACLDGPIPEGAFAYASTVAGLAKMLSEAGLQMNADTADEMSKHTGDKSASLLALVSAGSVGIENNAELAISQLENIASPQELRMFQDALILYRTPSELGQLLGQIGNARVARARRIGLFASFGLRRSLQRWSRHLSREISTVPIAAEWKRTAISNEIIHYSSGSVDASQKTLIVGFSGNQMRLMVPTYRILNCIDPGRFDLLLLWDPRRSMFWRGVEGAGPDFDGIVEFGRRFVEKRNFQRTITFGTSGGGLVAIYAAVKLGLSKAITVGPARPAGHHEIAGELKKLAALPSAKDTKILVTYGANSRDTDAANQLKEIFQSVSLHPEARFPNHNLLNELYKDGQLATFMNKVLNDQG